MAVLQTTLMENKTIQMSTENDETGASDTDVGKDKFEIQRDDGKDGEQLAIIVVDGVQSEETHVTVSPTSTVDCTPVDSVSVSKTLDLESARAADDDEEAVKLYKVKLRWIITVIAIAGPICLIAAFCAIYFPLLDTARKNLPEANTSLQAAPNDMKPTGLMYKYIILETSTPALDKNVKSVPVHGK